MDFALTDEQTALRSMARELFASVAAPAQLRARWDGAPRDPKAWMAIADVGIAGLGVPAEHGGSGGDILDIAVVMHEAGRACLPEPLLDTVAVAAPFLAQCGDDHAKAEWLPRIAAGEAHVAVLLADQPYAAHADTADLLLVEVDHGLHAVAAGGFTATPVATEDPTRRLCRVEYDAGQRLGHADLARELGAVATAAALNGIADALLQMTLSYVKVRRQFGVPVGSFQAVKHTLASVFATLESSTAATQYAAYAAAQRQSDRARAASIAKVHAVEAESVANAEALQCHAGIGFTWEHDLHFWLKRGRALEHAYGSAAAHRRRIAAALLDH